LTTFVEKNDYLPVFNRLNTAITVFYGKRFRRGATRSQKRIARPFIREVQKCLLNSTRLKN
jgi:hypothetical protein